jgi:DNA-binding XRE family transcriptional regulator
MCGKIISQGEGAAPIFFFGLELGGRVAGTLPGMKTSPPSHHAYEYAERICAGLPKRLIELRVAAGLKPYALAIRAGVSRDMIGDIERGKSIPTLFLAARLAFGLGMTLTEFVRGMEEGK